MSGNYCAFRRKIYSNSSRFFLTNPEGLCYHMFIYTLGGIVHVGT